MMRNKNYRLILAAKREGEAYDNMKHRVCTVDQVETVQAILYGEGYRIFFVLKTEMYVDEIADITVKFG
jgi:hypothetical protein